MQNETPSEAPSAPPKHPVNKLLHAAKAYAEDFGDRDGDRYSLLCTVSGGFAAMLTPGFINSQIDIAETFKQFEIVAQTNLIAINRNDLRVVPFALAALPIGAVIGDIAGQKLKNGVCNFLTGLERKAAEKEESESLEDEAKKIMNKPDDYLDL